MKSEREIWERIKELARRGGVLKHELFAPNSRASMEVAELQRITSAIVAIATEIRILRWVVDENGIDDDEPAL